MFSSLDLLVCKKDETWGFCVDKRTLSSTTNKDHFSVPTIHELLDKLYAIRWFSKLNMHSGYHRIGMDAGNIH